MQGAPRPVLPMTSRCGAHRLIPAVLEIDPSRPVHDCRYTVLLLGPRFRGDDEDGPAFASAGMSAFAARKSQTTRTESSANRSRIFAAVHPHSHSILSTHRNALIYSRKFFLTVPEIRTMSRQNFSLMSSKENSRDSNSATFQRLSTTIGRFFASSIAKRIPRYDRQHL